MSSVESQRLKPRLRDIIYCIITEFLVDLGVSCLQSNTNSSSQLELTVKQ